MAAMEERLKKAGVRCTKPRLRILQKMVTSKRHLWTIPDLQKAVTDCDLVTIYRTLSIFQRVGVVKRCELGDGIPRFEIVNVSEHHHHHIVCRECGDLEKLDHCVAKDLEILLAKRGYRKVSHSFEVVATCAKC